MSMLPYFFPFMFIAVFLLIIFILSRMGWADLVAHYRYDQHFEGTRIGMISASINSANYNNGLILKYNEEGMYIRPIVFFRMFHKAVLIPWKEIVEVREKKVLFIKTKQMIIGDPFVAIITVKESVFNKIEKEYLSHAFGRKSSDSHP